MVRFILLLHLGVYLFTCFEFTAHYVEIAVTHLCLRIQTVYCSFNHKQTLCLSKLPLVPYGLDIMIILKRIGYLTITV